MTARQSPILWAIQLALCLSGARGASPTTQPAGKSISWEAARVLERIVAYRAESGVRQAFINNSDITMPSPPAVVQQGATVLPQLLELMECDLLDFDTFTRCYGAADKIVSAAGAGRIWWAGGANYDDKFDRFGPLGQGDLALFRRNVCNDLRKKCRDLGVLDGPTATQPATRSSATRPGADDHSAH